MINPVKRFFEFVAKGDIKNALDTINDNVVFEAQGPTSVPIYGRFEGKNGVSKFIQILGEMFETEAFEIHNWTSSADLVYAFGYMQHRVRKTSAIFKSEWALVCRIENNRISSYKMFEDTAALEAAYNKAV